MAFHPLTDLRRLLNDFTRLDYDDPTLKQMLMFGAEEMARRGLLLQEQEVIDLQDGVVEYPLHPRWAQTFAILHEDIQVYIALRDQANVIWYLYVTDQGSTTLSQTRPPGIDLTPATIPHWFAWQSPNATTHYVHPSLVGSLTSSTTQPAVGAGISSTLELRSRRRIRYFVSVSNQGGRVLTPFSGTVAALRAGAPTVNPLTLITPEAFGRLEPGIADEGPPHYATIWRGRLWVSPTPDANYQLDHKFFATPLASPEVYDVPLAFRRLPVWKALSIALRSAGRIGPSQSVAGAFEQLLAYTATLYSPVERDSRQEGGLPR